MFANQNAGDPTKWTYLADTTRQSRTAGSWTVASLRLTLQATPRNKFNIYWDEQKPCTGATYSANDEGCRTQPSEGGFVYGGSPTAAPETATYENRFQRVQQLTWNSPVTNRVLLTAGFGDYLTRWGGDEMPGNADAQSGSRHRAVRAELPEQQRRGVSPEPDLSLRELGVALDGTAQLERVDDLRHRRAQHEVRLPGHLLRRRRAVLHQRRESRVPPQQRRAQSDHADAALEPAQAAHALSRACTRRSSGRWAA